MLDRIQREGDDAVRDYSRRLDGWDPPSFRVADEEIATAADQLTPDLREHIAFAQEQIRTFARHQRDTLAPLEVETLPGVVLGHRHVPVACVGSYVPGGRYPMLASAFMTVLVPKVAGVERVVACAPPWQGQGIHPAMLHSMASSGADEIVCLGGVQALAALALGLEDLSPVDMIVGAGNAYVAEAKRQLFGHVGIDLLAGPTEILVIADDSSDPELVAADLLGQAEHGPTSPCALISTSREVAVQALRAVDRLLEIWPTAGVAGRAWRDFGTVAVVDGRDEAIALADEFAPEHLEVQAAEDELDAYLGGLRNYGSLFLGREATVTYGDKAVGTNHVLPTGRAARYTGGLWVGKFLKTIAEMFAGHALTAHMRLERAAAASRQ